MGNSTFYGKKITIKENKSMGIRELFVSVSPKISSKILAFLLAFSITAVGFKCFAWFSSAGEPKENNDAEEEVTEALAPTEEPEKKQVFISDGASSVGTAINGVSGVFVSITERKILAEKSMNVSVKAGDISIFAVALTVSEAIKAQRAFISDEAVCPASAAKYENYNLSADVFSIGKKMKINDILKCMLYQRGSSYAYTLAVHISGSEEAFVAEMNSLCKKLGASQTEFTSVCGSEKDSGITTAYDTAVIMKAFLSDSLLKEMFVSEDYVTVEHGYKGSVYLVVKNEFFEKYCTENQSKNDGLEGGKIGYCGYSSWAVMFFIREGKEYVSVVTESKDAFSDALIMFAAFS